MKKNLLIAALLGAFTASSFAQGIVSFQRLGSGLKYTTDGTNLVNAPTGNPDNVPGFGAYTVAIYSATAGTALGNLGASPFNGLIPDLSNSNIWKIQTSALLVNIAPAPGDMTTANATLDSLSGAPGAVESLEVVAWAGNFASFQAALNGGALVGWTGSTLGGGEFGFQITTGSATLAGSINLVAGALANIVLAPVPEPGTIALGGLGAAALLLFRRRK